MEYKNCNKDKYLNNFTVFDHITDENNVVTLFFLNNFIYKTITYTTYSINYTYIVLATNTTDTYTYTNYAYTTLRYMYYNTININLIYGWRVYKVLFN